MAAIMASKSCPRLVLWRSTFSEWFRGANPQHVPRSTQERTHARAPMCLPFASGTVRATHEIRPLSLSKMPEFHDEWSVSAKLTLGPVAFRFVSRRWKQRSRCFIWRYDFQPVESHPSPFSDHQRSLEFVVRYAIGFCRVETSACTHIKDLRITFFHHLLQFVSLHTWNLRSLLKWHSPTRNKSMPTVKGLKMISSKTSGHLKTFNVFVMLTALRSKR